MDGTGWTTRSSTTSMSSDPAISRMNGRMVSATGEPSSGTSARLYMRGLLGPPGLTRAPWLLHGRARDPQQENRKSVVQGKSVDLGGRRIMKKKNTT